MNQKPEGYPEDQIPLGKDNRITSLLLHYVPKVDNKKNLPSTGVFSRQHCLAYKFGPIGPMELLAILLIIVIIF